MYQVIARKYRPQNFESVVGQEAVVTTLKNAISSGRLHHAYLFSGARGIGKTSLARIFAKAINCEKGATLQPCNECSACKEITQGVSLDVQEIDGASNNSVEEVREIRERLKYLPVSGRNKIYIIDEVHMLSTAAFNALLKTLEEPPPHVIFMLATTEVHKIPATVLSRCQRFDLRRISTEQLFTQLQSICVKETISPQPDSLLLISRESAGSLRDAQSLLDQAIAYTDGKLPFEQVAAMLGLANTRYIHDLTQAILKEDVHAALKEVKEIYDKGHDLKQFTLQWLAHWRNLLIYSTTQSEDFFSDLTEAEKKVVKEQSLLAPSESFDLGFHILHRAAEEIARSEFSKLLFDVLVVRLSHVREMEKWGDVLETLRAPAGAASAQTSQKMEGPKPSLSLSQFSSDLPKTRQDPNLNNFIAFVSSKNSRIASLLNHLCASAMAQDAVYFQFEKDSIWMDLLSEKKELLETMAQEFFGKRIPILIQCSEIPEDAALEIQKNVVRENPTLPPVVDRAIQILNAKIEEVNS